MKKALTITITLILGFGANCLIAWGLFYLAFEMYRTPIWWYAAAIAVIAAFTVLLCFVQKKLIKRVHGTAFVLCAQLPSIPVWLMGGVLIFGNVIITAIALLLANKDKWWDEPL